MNRINVPRLLFVVLAPMLWGAVVVHAEGMKGRLGGGVSGGESVGLGGHEVSDLEDNGTVAGGTVRYGLSEKLALGVSYENIDLTHGVRREPLTLSGVYYTSPNKRMTPVLELGVGSASGQSGGPFNNFSAKAGVGLEFFLTRMISLGPQLNFHYISETGHARYHAWVMSPGLIAMIYFGGDKSQPAAQTTQSPPPAATSPVAEPVAVPPPAAPVAAPAPQ